MKNEIFKKIIAMIGLLVMVYSFSACDFGKKTETVFGDFSLTVTVNKTKMIFDDTITMTLKNLTGKDVYIKTPNKDCIDLEHLLVPFIIPELLDIGFEIGVDGQGHELILEKDATIQRTVKLEDAVWPIGKNIGKKEIVVKALFYISDNYSENFNITTNPIKITIKDSK